MLLGRYVTPAQLKDAMSVALCLAHRARGDGDFLFARLWELRYEELKAASASAGRRKDLSLAAL